MRHLVRGVALEYGKLGRLTLESDFERFHELIRPAATARLLLVALARARRAAGVCPFRLPAGAGGARASGDSAARTW